LKFGYSYKTSEGKRLESTFEAKSKEEVFAALRAQGVKPIKVWEVRPWYYVSLRTRIIIVLAVLSAVSVIYSVRTSRAVAQYKVQDAKKSGRTSPRHQIYGDPATWEAIERDNFASVFHELGDRILACYAIPGHESASSFGISRPDMAKALDECMPKDVEASDSDSPETAELKRIVQGMKEELRWYVGDGEGTSDSYLQRLRERQEEESRIYERTRKELENCTDNALREERNASLRALGLRTIPRPKRNGYQ